MGRTLFLVLSSVFLAFVPAAGQSGNNYQNAQIAWDSATLTLIQPGGVYGRMVRLADRAVLCAFEWNGAVFVRRSSDEGRTWTDPVQAASFEFGTANNPELLVLQNGTVMLSYNQRPTDGAHPYTIRVCFSQDDGDTWTDDSLVFQAGITSQTGCWEPAQIQLPDGEIQLYFSNEQPYPKTGEQQITMVSSFENGQSWTPPIEASFRPGHRDGMAVPLNLADGSGVVISIEDNGLSGTFKPALEPAPMGGRWAALQTELPAEVYAGAPYIRQFPSGETILSVQSGWGRTDPGTLDDSQMVVYIGDPTGHGFTNMSVPFDVPPGESGLWNSLFVKNPVTVTAISSTTIGGVSGVWAIDGYLEYQGVLASPSIRSVTNIAGGPLGPVAPGEFVVISGSGLIPATTQGGPSQPAVYFNGIASPVAYISGNQINAVVPYGVSGVADAVVQYGGAGTLPFPLGLVPAAPEVFNASGATQAVAVNQDNSLNGSGNPVARGSYLSFWASGQGQVKSVGGYAVPVLPVSAAIGGVSAPVTFAGLIDTGVLQVNIVIPPDAPVGPAIPLVLTIGTSASQQTSTLAIQ